MVYLCGDNDLESSGVADLAEMKRVGSSAACAVVAQFDRYHQGRPTRRYYLRRNTSLASDAVGKPLGETDTGQARTLAEFVRWSIGAYPARHYMLVVWNHGAGWDDTDVYAPMASMATGSRGMRRPRAEISRLRARDALFRSTATTVADNYAIGFDDHAHDFLDNIELKRAIAAAHKAAGRKIDIIGMDACLMSMAEVAYQLRSDADYVIASLACTSASTSRDGPAGAIS